jgi:hypothetical protein
MNKHLLLGLCAIMSSLSMHAMEEDLLRWIDEDNNSSTQPVNLLTSHNAHVLKERMVHYCNPDSTDQFLTIELFQKIKNAAVIIHAMDQQARERWHQEMHQQENCIKITRCLDPDNKFLKKVRFGNNPLIMHAAYLGNYELVRLCLNNDADPDEKGVIEMTALHLAVMRGNAAIVKLLLRGGACPNAQSIAGYSPLYWAACHFQKDIIEILLQHGADPNVACVFGSTPLMNIIDPMTRKKSEKEIRDVVMLLLSYGADVTLKDYKQQTAYDIAVKKGYATIAKLVKHNHHKIA